MKVIYTAGPFRAKTPWAVENNVRKAEKVALRIAKMGAMPLCPHTNTRFFDGLLTQEFWINGTLELMRRCDAVLMLPGWEDSVGSRGEEKEALRLKLPVFYNEFDLKAYIENE